MMTKEEVETHLEGLKNEEKYFLDSILVCRGAIRSCEAILQILPPPPEDKLPG